MSHAPVVPGPSGLLGELSTALEQLPPEQCIPWMLHVIEGETLPATARACGVSLATVKRRIARAESFITEKLELRS